MNIIQISVNDRVINASKLVDDLYNHPDCAGGGYGHIVFEDGNFDLLDVCIRDCEQKGSAYLWPEEVRILSLKALLAFKNLTEYEMQMALWLTNEQNNWPLTPFRISKQ